MDEQVRLPFPKIYSKLGELREFVFADIIQENSHVYTEIEGLVEEMSGEANKALRNTINKNIDKTNSAAKALLSIIDFMESSTRDMERYDQDLGMQLSNEGGEVE